MPSSGTKNISVRNPVYDLSLLHSIDNTNYSLKQKLQTGFSSRYWLHSELENEIEDSTSNETQGMYFEIDNRYIKKDSTLLFKLGYRYVDPDFRSAGSQTRRIDYIDGNNNTIYPFYTNMSVPRQPSLFDLVSDEQLYNQDISSLLMAFNPIYSNILPYGDATPNRSGVYLNAKINNSNKLILVKIKTGFYKEILGQGALEKRSFRLLKGSLKINLHKSLNLKKELSLIASSESERTVRGGDEISSLNLISNHMNISVNAELAKKFFVQASYKQFNANGNEFLIQRDNFGNITYYTPSQIDQKDHMLSIGTMYKFRKNIYANVHYNWWGLKFIDQPSLDYKYNRLLLILSVKL